MDESICFPKKLYYLHNPNQEVLQSCVARLEFLYLSILGLVKQNGERVKDSSLVHILSQNLIKQSQEQQIDIPSYILEQFCVHCSCFQVPGLTYQVRFKKYNRNRHKSDNKVNLKNEMIVVCLQCGQRIRKCPGFKRQQTTKSQTGSMKQESFDLELQSTPAKLKAVVNTPSQGSIAGSRTPIQSNSSSKKFSFLNSLSSITKPTKSSMLSQPTSSSEKYRHSVSNELRSPVEDFIPLGDIPSDSRHRVSLLDIEKANKKKKKRLSVE